MAVSSMEHKVCWVIWNDLSTLLTHDLQSVLHHLVVELHVLVDDEIDKTKLFLKSDENLLLSDAISILESLKVTDDGLCDDDWLAYWLSFLEVI